MCKALLICVFAGLFCFSASAQTDSRSNVFLGGTKPEKQKRATTRTVKGMVTDVNGKPLEHALVTLTNEDTHVSLTFVTKDDGRYIFDGLSFNNDYKLVAQYKTGKSPERTLSQYDRTPNIVRILTVDEPEPAARSGDTQSARQNH